MLGVGTVNLSIEKFDENWAILLKMLIEIFKITAEILANLIENNEIKIVIYPEKIIIPKIGVINIVDTKKVNEAVKNNW